MTFFDKPEKQANNKSPFFFEIPTNTPNARAYWSALESGNEQAFFETPEEYETPREEEIVQDEVQQDDSPLFEAYGEAEDNWNLWDEQPSIEDETDYMGMAVVASILAEDDCW